MQLRTQSIFIAAASSVVSLGLLAACSSDDNKTVVTTPTKDTGTIMPVDSGMPPAVDSGTPQTACQKYGGAANIDKIVQTDLVTALAGDCRISRHFTDLINGSDASRLVHVSECLSTQVQELFGCEGVKYEGSKDKAGAACRNMVAAHANAPNKIAQKDFDALIEDVVAVLTAKGVSAADIGAVAPALTSPGMKAAVITAPAATPTNCNVQPDTTSADGKCAAATGITTCSSPAQSACVKYGGRANIDKIVQEDLVTALAGDCRISKHFTDLVSSTGDATRLVHVKECLSTQVQELFGCPGASYAGSKDKAGVLCRDMVAAHASAPSKIAQKDFDALIEDVVAVLTAKGVTAADIGAVAPALTSTSMKAAVITAPGAAPTNCNIKPDTSAGKKCAVGGASPTTTCATGT